MTTGLKFDIDYQSVDNIFECRNIGEVKAAVTAFITATDEVCEMFNGMFVYMLCQRFENTFVEWAKRYFAPAKGSAWNVVIVPPEHAPIMLLPSCVPFGGAPVDVIGGLKKFIERCNEFTSPIHDAIPKSEMNRTLTYAQKTYRILDIIALDEPLKILRFDNSHTVYNSQCAIPSNSKQAVIFSFHPNNVEVHDRVFIFAHELGHALHLSLTREIDILPEGV